MMNLIKHENLVDLDDAASMGSIPETPGVYTFRDGEGGAIYVGKAKNLKRRVSGYLRRVNRYLEDRTRRMIHQARQLHIFETETELLALLLEDQLIKEYRPEFNIRQKDIFKHRYLAFSSVDYPALEMLDEPRARDRPLFGPYRDKYAAGGISDIVCKWFGIRPCPDPMPGQTCSYYDMQICGGPCQSLISPEDYSRSVRLATAFLSGDETILVDRMAASLEDHSRGLRYEQAAEIVRTMEYCHRLAKRQRFFRSFAAGRLVLYEQGDRDGTYLFSKGWLVEYLARIIPSDDVHIVAGGEEDGDERLICDRSNIVYNWINRHQSEHYFLPIA
ncbi:GIY-YIG nuclease family protein [Candidatus Neomarinimicrobiota bacterium]